MDKRVKRDRKAGWKRGNDIYHRNTGGNNTYLTHVHESNPNQLTEKTQPGCVYLRASRLWLLRLNITVTCEKVNCLLLAGHTCVPSGLSSHAETPLPETSSPGPRRPPSCPRGKARSCGSDTPRPQDTYTEAPRGLDDFTRPASKMPVLCYTWLVLRLRGFIFCFCWLTRHKISS